METIRFPLVATTKEWSQAGKPLNSLVMVVVQIFCPQLLLEALVDAEALRPNSRGCESIISSVDSLREDMFLDRILGTSKEG